MTTTLTVSNKRDEERVALENLGDLISSAQRAVNTLWELHETKYGADGEYIRDGAFTDAGIKRLRQMFFEGKRNMELAKFFGVTDAAIAYQRKQWKKQEGNIM